MDAPASSRVSWLATGYIIHTFHHRSHKLYVHVTRMQSEVFVAGICGIVSQPCIELLWRFVACDGTIVC